MIDNIYYIVADEIDRPNCVTTINTLYDRHNLKAPLTVGYLLNGVGDFYFGIWKSIAIIVTSPFNEINMVLLCCPYETCDTHIYYINGSGKPTVNEDFNKTQNRAIPLYNMEFLLNNIEKSIISESFKKDNMEKNNHKLAVEYIGCYDKPLTIMCDLVDYDDPNYLICKNKIDDKMERLLAIIPHNRVISIKNGDEYESTISSDQA